MLLKIKEIQEQYKIGKTTLMDWERQGIIKALRTPGNHRRYFQKDIEKLLGYPTKQTKE